MVVFIPTVIKYNFYYFFMEEKTQKAEEPRARGSHSTALSPTAYISLGTSVYIVNNNDVLICPSL